jgi:hypothetical protein
MPGKKTHHKKHPGQHDIAVDQHHKGHSNHSKGHHAKGHKKHHHHHNKRHEEDNDLPHDKTETPYENIQISKESSINLNKIQENTWSLQCDRLLIFGQGFEAKLQAWQDIHKKITKIHPKGTMLTLDEIKKRYESLITNENLIPRLELLRLSIEDEVLRKGVGVAASYGVVEPVIRKVADNDDEGKSKSQTEGNLKIKCFSKKSRGRDVPAILGVKQRLERTSPLLSAVLKQERDVLNDLLPGGLSADPCLRYDAKNRTLEIHENCQEFKNDETYGFCEKHVVEKYLIFCEDSSILSRFKESRKVQNDFDAREKLVNDDMERSLKIKMNNLLDDLQKKQKVEITNANEKMEELKEMEMKLLNEKYERLERAQERALKVEHEKQCNSIISQFTEQMHFARKISKSRLQRRRKKAIESKIAQFERQLTKIFHSDSVLKLLVLSEYLLIDSLRDACMEQLTRSPGERRKELLLEVLDDPALRSSLLPEITIRSMIQRLSTRALLEIENEGSVFAYYNIVLRELNSRSKNATDAYSKLKNDEIIDLKIKLDKYKKERREIYRAGSWYPAFEDLERARIEKSFKGNDEAPEKVAEDGDDDGEIATTNDNVNTFNLLNEPLSWREPPFEKILNLEMERRRKYATVKMNKLNLPKSLVLDPSETVVTLIKPHQYGTGHATLPRKAKSFGKWMMEFKIVHFPIKESSISVGFDVPRDLVEWKSFDKTAPTPRGSIETIGQVGQRGISMPGITTDTMYGRAGIAWKSDGKKSGGLSVINVAGKTFSELESFIEGDVLTFAFDQDNAIPRIQIYKNGEKLIPSGRCQEYLRNYIKDSYWKEKREHINLEGILMEGDLPIINYNNYELLPSVCMYSTLRHGIGKPSVRCNFAGPFQHPLEGYEGYGADLNMETRRQGHK